MKQRQIRLDNLPLFISCFPVYDEVLVKYRSEIDGDIYVTLEYDENISFDEEEYQNARSSNFPVLLRD